MNTNWMFRGWRLPCCSAVLCKPTRRRTKRWKRSRSTNGEATAQALQPIEAAIVATKADAAARKALETSLAEVLKGDAPQAAKDFVCRQLSLIGTTESVPALATLLQDEKLSHMARYALERIPDDAAVQALARCASQGGGPAQGRCPPFARRTTRRAECGGHYPVAGGPGCQIAGAAAHALGGIGTAEAAKALSDFQPKAPEPLRAAVADACLACAEHLLADGKKTEAIAIYKALGKPEQPKHVQVAARRGLLAAMGQK